MSVEYIFLGLFVLLIGFFVFKAVTKKDTPTQPPVISGTGVNGDREPENIYPKRKKT